jgi:hypothetical protein
MRRLQVLPCPESWDRMRADGDGPSLNGRYCERCQLPVTEVAKLDGAGLDELVAAAEGGRVCARFELEGGRPRTKLGLAAGLVVIALAGCATPVAPASQMPSNDEAAFFELIEADEGSEGGMIAGAVRSPEGFPIANAIVILQSVALEAQIERYTDERGIYKFENLPPGNYTIQLLANKANVSKITQLPENARFRANFVVDPDAPRLVLGVVTEATMIDTTSPASTYSSKLLEYE